MLDLLVLAVFGGSMGAAGLLLVWCVRQVAAEE